MKNYTLLTYQEITDKLAWLGRVHEVANFEEIQLISFFEKDFNTKEITDRLLYTIYYDGKHVKESFDNKEMAMIVASQFSMKKGSLVDSRIGRSFYDSLNAEYLEKSLEDAMAEVKRLREIVKKYSNEESENLSDSNEDFDLTVQCINDDSIFNITWGKYYRVRKGQAEHYYDVIGDNGNVLNNVFKNRFIIIEK